MATSLNSYSVKLGMDAAGFIDATKVSRMEAKLLIRDIEGARDPMEKFAVEQDRLTKALSAGAIDQGTYNRLLDSKRVASMGATAALGPLSIAIAGVATAAATAAAGGAAFISWMRTAQGRIDETADKAERLGLSFTELKTLQFGFDEGGGLDASTVEGAVGKLQANMAKAVSGDQGLRDAFGKLGIDAGQLMGVGPEEALLQIADKMEGIDSLAERMRISMELFGKSGIEVASTLGKGRDVLQESMEFQRRWGSLTDSQVAGVGSLNDSIGRVSVIIEGVTNKLAAELAPAFQIISDSVLEGAKGVDSVDVAIKNAVTTATILVGTFMDGLEVANEIGRRFEALHKADLEGLTKPMDDSILSLDKARDAYAQLEKNRAKARLDGIEAAAKREAEKHAKEMLDTEEAVKAKLEGVEKAAKEQERMQQEAERAERTQAERALAAAEQRFQKEIDRQQKLQADMAKGPDSYDVGSAGYAKLLADNANRVIANNTTEVKPSDEQLIEEARKQLAEQQAQTAKLESMVAELRFVKDAVKDNTIVRAR